MVSKERFLKDINALQEANDYQNGYNQFLKNFKADGYVYQPDCSSALLEHLHEACGTADKNDLIALFCYNLDFGRKWKPGSVKDDFNNDIDLSSSEKLYNYLLTQM